jgi:hypothetical protein
VTLVALSNSWSYADGLLIDHTATAAFDTIPADMIDSVGRWTDIYFGRASHGRQLHVGLDMLQAEDSLLTPPGFAAVDVYVDQDGIGDTSWVPDIRVYLASHPECRMVIMAWCQGVARGTEASINIYLNKMTQLEVDYPDVYFIYMTAHLSVWAPENTTARNEQIRQYCLTNEKILYDFADIESWDPDGNYYPDETDTCTWCETWCQTYVCPDCDGCPHSHCFNCYQKARAWWWMMARLSGWGYPSEIGPPETVQWREEE